MAAYTYQKVCNKGSTRLSYQFGLENCIMGDRCLIYLDLFIIRLYRLGNSSSKYCLLVFWLPLHRSDENSLRKYDKGASVGGERAFESWWFINAVENCRFFCRAEAHKIKKKSTLKIRITAKEWNSTPSCRPYPPFLGIKKLNDKKRQLFQSLHTLIRFIYILLQDWWEGVGVSHFQLSCLLVHAFVPSYLILCVYNTAIDLLVSILRQLPSLLFRVFSEYDDTTPLSRRILLRRNFSICLIVLLPHFSRCEACLVWHNCVFCRSEGVCRGLKVGEERVGTAAWAIMKRRKG